MPLNQPTLINALREFMDPKFGGFVGHPSSAEDAAQKWASAFKRYMLETVNPPPNPAAASAGEQAMSGVLAPIISSDPTALQKGFTAFMVAYIPLTLPFVSAPPPAPVLIIAPIPPQDGQTAATMIAGLVDTWARTALSSVPPSAPIPFS